MGLASALVCLNDGVLPESFEGLKSRLDIEWIESALATGGVATVRNRKLAAEQVVWLVVGVGLYRDRPIAELVQRRQRVYQARSERGGCMYLFFDTETTGLPKNYKAPVSDIKNWPRLVQIAWLVTDDGGKEIKSAEYIIKPNGFSIPAEAAEIHGITDEIASRSGVELKPVLEEIAADISTAAILIAHNIQFDEMILGAEFLRMESLNHLEGKPRKCTMKASTDFCQLPGPRGNKWPKLQELHVRLFRKGFDKAHNALVDVRACSKCYFELRRIGVMD